MPETKHPVTEFDCFFLSYDEPNADKHWADLRDKAPWAERVHGVKGFAAAHEACANQSTTDWFITVDADNIVMPDFFNQEVTLDVENRPNLCYTWNGLNMMNGLQYGNGGIKLWSKKFVLDGGIGHERATDPKHAVDFCWQPDYITLPQTFSEVWNNGSAQQAFRVGFREGVKLTLHGGERIAGKEMRHRLHPVNLRNIRIWSSVGRHVEHGLYAIAGARMGWQAMLAMDWDHRIINDYAQMFWMGRMIPMDICVGETAEEFEERLVEQCLASGDIIARETGIALPLLDAAASAFFCDTFKHRNI